ncbi:hypothetical protein FRC17_000920 [Serendipita sp. 399]|nr:hypothetical protein FRC17_000920 [Serendipita sp. 399]
MASFSTLNDRVRGCLVGGALGDAIGLFCEFFDSQRAKELYGENPKFKLRPPAPPGSNYKVMHIDRHRGAFEEAGWTDDTDQALLILMAFLKNGGPGQGITAQDFANRLKHWVSYGFRPLDRLPLGLGRTVGSVVRNEAFLKDPIARSTEIWEAGGRVMAANGAVMRTPIVGALFYTNQDILYSTAIDIAATTHADPRCLASCTIASALVAALFRSIGYTYKCLASGIWALRQGIAALSAPDEDPDRLSNLFERVITELTMAGGDSDTNCAVAGSLLGCLIGYANLPVGWKEDLKHRDWLLSKADAATYLIAGQGAAYSPNEDKDNLVDGDKGEMSKEEIDAKWLVMMETMHIQDAKKIYGPNPRFKLKPPAPEGYTCMVMDEHRAIFDEAGFTDDTDQSLLILMSFLCSGGVTRNGIDPLDFARRLRHWVEYGFRPLNKLAVDVGNTVSTVVNDSDFLSDPLATSARVWVTGGRKNAANGAVMRTCVIGAVFFDKMEQLYSSAITCAATTHADPRCLASCTVASAIVAALVRDEIHTEEDIKAVIKDAIKPVALRSPGIKPEQVEELETIVWRNSLADLKLDELRSIGYTFKCLASGIWALRQGLAAKNASRAPNAPSLASTFERVITELTMAGGDSDTNAAVAGSMLGALFGYSNLPPEWLQDLNGGAWLLKKADAAAYLILREGEPYDYKEDQDNLVDGGKGDMSKQELAVDHRRSAALQNDLRILDPSATMADEQLTPQDVKKSRRQTAFYPAINNTSNSKPFSKSAARRESVLALGSIEHLQYYFTKTGLASKPKPGVKTKGLVPAIGGGHLRTPSAISGLPQLTFDLPPSPVVPQPTGQSFAKISVVKNYEVDPDELLPGLVADLERVSQSWALGDSEHRLHSLTSSPKTTGAADRSQLTPTIVGTGDFDVLSVLRATTNAIRSVRNYLVALPDDQDPAHLAPTFRPVTISRRPGRISNPLRRTASFNDPLVSIRRSALDVLTSLREIEEKYRLPMTEDSFEVLSENGSGSTRSASSPNPQTSGEDDAESSASFNFSVAAGQGRKKTVTVWSDDEGDGMNDDDETERKERWEEKLVLGGGWLYRNDVFLANVEKERDVVKRYLDTVDSVLFYADSQSGVRGWAKALHKLREERRSSSRSGRVTPEEPAPPTFGSFTRSGFLDAMHNMSLGHTLTEEPSSPLDMDEDHLPKWAKRTEFIDDPIGRAFALLVALLPVELLYILPSPSETPTSEQLMLSLSSGQLLCVAYNVGVRKSKKPWGYINKAAVHDIASLEAETPGSLSEKDQEKRRIGWTYRRTENLRLWVAALKMRYMIPFTTPAQYTATAAAAAAASNGSAPSSPGVATTPYFFDAAIVAKREPLWEEMLHDAVLLWVEAVVRERRGEA